MAAGIFKTIVRDPQNPQDILFVPTENNTDADDEEQLSLKDQIDKVLQVLRIMFKDDDPNFEYYFIPLLSLAQTGLWGSTCHPKIASRALNQLKDEMVSREGGRIKNKYMRDLGKKALMLAVLPLILGTIMYFIRFQPDLTAFFFLWSSCMGGVWLSFGVRKTTIQFEDLGSIEEDQVEPILRLIFTGLLTIIIGLLFYTKAVTVEMGDISTVSIVSDIRVSIIVGVICGFSEKALPAKIREQSRKLLGG